MSCADRVSNKTKDLIGGFASESSEHFDAITEFGGAMYADGIITGAVATLIGAAIGGIAILAKDAVVDFWNKRKEQKT